MAQVIETERLRIRPLRSDDWQGLRDIAADFARSSYVVYDHPLPTGEAAIRDLTRRFAETGLWFAVTPRDGEKMMGYVCFHGDGGSYDLGYCFHSAFQGKGYACESCAALMEHMARHHDVQCFTAGTALKNTPSRRLLEKLGFTLRGTETLTFHKDTAGRDIFFEGGNFIKRNDTK